MEKTKEFPVLINDFVSRDLLLAAKQFVDEFKGGVFPILHRFKMLDDEHKRSFWRGLIKEVKINEDAEPVEIIY